MKGQNAWVGITPEILNQWQEESAKWKALAGELFNIAKRDHGHDLRLPCADCEKLAKAREAGL